MGKTITSNPQNVKGIKNVDEIRAFYYSKEYYEFRKNPGIQLSFEDVENDAKLIDYFIEWTRKSLEDKYKDFYYKSQESDEDELRPTYEEVKSLNLNVVEWPDEQFTMHRVTFEKKDTWPKAFKLYKDNGWDIFNVDEHGFIARKDI